MAISNHEIAAVLREIGIFLDMQKVPFKPRAYEKAALAVADLEEEAEAVYKRGGLKSLRDIPGIGASIAETIEELIKTGRCGYYEELRREAAVNLRELSGIEGLGPQSIKKLHEKLGVRSLRDLEEAANKHRIRELKGFGPKAEENILRGISFIKISGNRFLLSQAANIARELENDLKKIKGVEKIAAAGSFRRRKESVGDIDILILADEPKPIMDFFVRMPGVLHVAAHGDTKSSVKLASGINVDLRIVPAESYGAALNYFTGSKEHNVALRQIAIGKGYKLNEYGIFKKERGGKERYIAGKTEGEIYRTLGLDYIEPELRENTGEILAAQEHRLPKLIGYGDIEGDLQVQTDWTDGSDSIETMAKAALKRGLKYIAITDHTKRLAMTGGLDEKKLLRQMAEIDGVNKKLGGKIKILKGTECDILKDGTLDIDDSVLSKLDVVGISVHSYFNLPRAEQTERIIRAMRNPHADILFHPTGRVIFRRPPYDVDIDEIIKTAKETKTVLEIDAYPDRLDLKDEHIRKCVESGVKMSIDSDAHNPSHFPYLEYGIAQARRGWAERKDIINAWPAEKMLKQLK